METQFIYGNQEELLQLTDINVLLLQRIFHVCIKQYILLAYICSHIYPCVVYCSTMYDVLAVQCCQFVGRFK